MRPSVLVSTVIVSGGRTDKRGLVDLHHILRWSHNDMTSAHSTVQSSVIPSGVEVNTPESWPWFGPSAVRYCLDSTIRHDVGRYIRGDVARRLTHRQQELLEQNRFSVLSIAMESNTEELSQIHVRQQNRVFSFLVRMRYTSSRREPANTW